MSTVLALPVESEEGITISALGSQNSPKKFAEMKRKLALDDLTDHEIQGIVQRRVDIPDAS